MKRITLLTSLGGILLAIGCSDDSKTGGPTSPDSPPEPGEYYVDIYDSTRVCQGTNLFTDGHEPGNMRVVETDMEGDVLWEFILPESWISGTIVGFEAELLESGNILITISGSGIYEIDRSGNTVWEHPDPKCSHDADRLANGNTIYVFGKVDTRADASVKEVNAQGESVWEWKAFAHYNESPYTDVAYQGWTHTNAVTRLQNGHTLISLRNFDMTVEVDSEGSPVWEFQWEDLYPTTTFPALYPHDPEIHDDNTLLVCLQAESPYQLVEIDRATGNALWEYQRDTLRVCRDGDRLPNGNVLVVGVMGDLNESVIFEVTPDQEIVWQLRLYQTPVNQQPGYFYKAQRICS